MDRLSHIAGDLATIFAVTYMIELLWKLDVKSKRVFYTRVLCITALMLINISLLALVVHSVFLKV